MEDISFDHIQDIDMEDILYRDGGHFVRSYTGYRDGGHVFRSYTGYRDGGHFLRSYGGHQESADDG